MTNYYIMVPRKTDKTDKIYFLCSVGDIFTEDYFLESSKFYAISFSDEKYIRKWIEEFFPFPNNRENNPVWSCLSDAEKENFDWSKCYILK